MAIHHVIPVSICWENDECNKIKIWYDTHKELHVTQDISYNIIRRFREKTNHILIPNDYVLDSKEEVWQRYFERPTVEQYLQLRSLNYTAKKYNTSHKNSENFNEVVNNIITYQKIIIKQILSWKM
jgi:hypothetical protein